MADTFLSASRSRSRLEHTGVGPSLDGGRSTSTGGGDRKGRLPTSPVEYVSGKRSHGALSSTPSAHPPTRLMPD